MKVYYDLHIHSCLSPCADEDMTPNNIVNMAMIKGLDLIAVADHNATHNLPAVMAVAKKRDILVIPAMELQTAEEVHLLCLFKSYEAIRRFQAEVDQRLLGIPNHVKKFGSQVVMNELDEPVAELPQALIFSTQLSFEEALHLVRQLEGIVLPAHINRQANGVLAVLGFIPPEANFTAVEISSDEAGSQFLEQYKDRGKYQIIRNSDAHQLMSISEREHYFDIEERSIEAVFDYLMKRMKDEGEKA